MWKRRSQLSKWDRPLWRYALHLGPEFIGRVAEVGDPDHADHRVGDFVTVLTFDSCGKCDPCRSGRPGICESLVNCGFGKDGTYVKYVKVSSRKVYRFRPNIDPKVAIMTSRWLSPYSIWQRAAFG